MSKELVRYGVQWNGPDEPLCASMSDGYWTPWHVANDALLAAARERDELREWQREAASVLRAMAACSDAMMHASEESVDALNALLARVKP